MTLTHTQAMKQPAIYAAALGLRPCVRPGYQAPWAVQAVFAGSSGVRADQAPPPR